MIRRAGFFLVLSAFAPVAQAQDMVLEPFCQEILQYQQEKAADYRPGVDVKGHPVAPADLMPSANSIKYPIEIPVEIDVIKLMNADAPDMPDVLEEAGQMEAQVALVQVFEDGRIEYDGQDISDRSSYICREKQPAPAQEGGQAPPVPLTSDAKPEPQTP
jgi:hypothetical protein